MARRRAISAFAETLGLARTVFPYVESHNFYVEHWYHTLFWNKVREFGALLVDHEFIGDVEDIFYLNRHEVAVALDDVQITPAMAGHDPTPGNSGPP